MVGSGHNLNSSKLLCMSLLPARMKMIPSKMKGLEWSQDCSYYKSMFVWGFFSRRSRAANSAVLDWILAEFRTHPYTYGFPNYLQESRRSDQN